MREVKRYDPINNDGTCGMCVEDADYGAYVEYADYAALDVECDALRQQLANLGDSYLQQLDAVSTRNFELRKQRDKLAGLLREAAGELRTDRHHGLRPKIYAALSEPTP